MFLLYFIVLLAKKYYKPQVLYGTRFTMFVQIFITQFRFMSQALIMQEGTVIRLNARQSKNCTESCPNLLMRATLICSKQKLVTDPS